MPRGRRALILAAAVLANLSLGTLGFFTIADFPLVDAAYMAIMTMTTVGYGEIHPLSR